MPWCEVLSTGFFDSKFPALSEFVKMGKPVRGTCAGLIFLANKAVGRRKEDRNSWVASIVQCIGTSSGVCYKVSKHIFQCQNLRPSKEAVKHSAEFLYALLLFSRSLKGSPTNHTVGQLINLGKMDMVARKVIVAVRQGNLLGTAFHPELTADSRWHSYFLKMAREVEGGPSNSIVTIGSSPDLSFNVDKCAVNDFPIFE